MPRNERFTFLCSQKERQTIEKLAHKLQRSQSDVVRLVVLEAARVLEESDKKPNSISMRDGWSGERKR